MVSGSQARAWILMGFSDWICASSRSSGSSCSVLTRKVIAYPLVVKSLVEYGLTVFAANCFAVARRLAVSRFHFVVEMVAAFFLHGW